MLADIEHQFRTTRRRLRRAFVSALAVALAIAAIAAGRAYFHRDEFTIDLSRPTPETLLAEVIQKARLSTIGAGPVEAEELEGTMPASASRILKVGQSAQQTRRMIVGACRRLGFGAPDALERSAEPDLVCRGDWNEWFASVHLVTKCAGACDANIIVRAI